MRVPARDDLRRVRRRIRLLAACIDGPTDVWLAVRMLGWRIALPALKYRLPLPKLAELMWLDGGTRARRADQERRITMLARGLYGPRELLPLDNCLERSLVLYRFLSEAGAAPRLLVGVGGADSVLGHAWVILDGEPVHETRASLEEWAPVLAFGAGGAAQRLEPQGADALLEDPA
jgi:hypothetical protein